MKVPLASTTIIEVLDSQIINSLNCCKTLSVTELKLMAVGDFCSALANHVFYGDYEMILKNWLNKLHYVYVISMSGAIMLDQVAVDTSCHVGRNPLVRILCWLVNSLNIAGSRWNIAKSSTLNS